MWLAVARCSRVGPRGLVDAALVWASNALGVLGAKLPVQVRTIN
jgi:hypothetical protein